MNTIRRSVIVLLALGLAGCAGAGGSAGASHRGGPGAYVRGPGASGTLIVLNRAEASASLLDCRTGEELVRLPTGDGPREVAVSPDGATAVVTNYGLRGEPGNSLTVIDVPARSVRTTVGLGSYHRPHGIQFLPDGRQLMLTAEQERAVLLVDIASAAVVGALSTGQPVSRMLVLTPDARRAFVASITSGNVTVVDLEHAQAIAHIETGQGAEGIDISPDGREVWVGNRAVDTISIIDTRTLEVVETLPCASFPIRVKFTPDGDHVLVSNARSGDVAVFDAAERREVHRIAMPAEAVDETGRRISRDAYGHGPVPVGVLIEPQGRLAFVADTNLDVVTVIDLERWMIVGQLIAGREPGGLGYSPIAFSR
jgi:YVTN family beta-propeller protein